MSTQIKQLFCENLVFFCIICVRSCFCLSSCKKTEQVAGIPAELQILLDKNAQAKFFFDTLAPSYKKGYCDWVGSAKQEATRQVRAEKALIMLKKGQKTLKT